MKQVVALIALALAASGASAASAGEVHTGARAVVELFTSQGCSSCPPADAYLSELNGRPGVVTLAYHVDYWDYIGWKDTFGSAANSDLQRAYAAARGESRIYTPQMLINGVTDAVGSRRPEVERALAGASANLQVELKSGDGMLDVSVEGNPDLPESALWMVTFVSDAKVHIGSGENRDRDMDYSQIVTGRQVLGMWDPVDGVHIKLPLADVLGTSNTGVALIVQQDNAGLPGRILGASTYTR